MSRVRRSSFVVRAVEDRQGHVSGVIERVATGATEAFQDLEEVGGVIRGMLRDEPRAGGGGRDPRGTGARGDAPSGRS